MAQTSSKSTRSPAFQFYPRDFLVDTNVDLMSMTERGIYITLLSRCWLDSGLPLDQPALAKLVRMKPQQFARIWTNGPLAVCFYERDGKLQHKRLDHERKIQAEFRRKQKERAESRWNTKPIGNATAQPMAGNAPQSASAIRNPHSAERGTPLTSRRRPYAAWEGEKGLYVPQGKHNDFVQLRNHPDADRELYAWYGEVAAAWEGSPGADMVKFWAARFDEKWPPAAGAKAPATSKANEPEWVTRAKAAQRAARS